MPWERVYSAAIDGGNAMSAVQAKGMTRQIMAEFYRDCIIADQQALKDGRERVDFKALNRAIIERWSVYGLNWIKERAWKGK